MRGNAVYVVNQRAATKSPPGWSNQERNEEPMAYELHQPSLDPHGIHDENDPQIIRKRHLARKLCDLLGTHEVEHYTSPGGHKLIKIGGIITGGH